MKTIYLPHIVYKHLPKTCITIGILGLVFIPAAPVFVPGALCLYGCATTLARV